VLEAERILVERGIPYRLIELTDRAMTAADVARFSKGDFKLEEICKTVVMSDSEGNLFAFFMVGTDRVDFLKAKATTGKKLSVANPSVVRAKAGEPGAVCPLTISIPIVVDTRVINLPRVNFGSGHHLHGIEMATSDLLHIIPHTVADVAEEKKTL
jgi:prolyl-tRNA editing enzyme YbaK/EbsC (Cys-tRNA(Pro) deacylase)